MALALPVPFMCGATSMALALPGFFLWALPGDFDQQPSADLCDGRVLEDPGWQGNLRPCDERLPMNTYARLRPVSVAQLR